MVRRPHHNMRTNELRELLVAGVTHAHTSKTQGFVALPELLSVAVYRQPCRQHLVSVGIRVVQRRHPIIILHVQGCIDVCYPGHQGKGTV